MLAFGGGGEWERLAQVEVFRKPDSLFISKIPMDSLSIGVLMQRALVLLFIFLFQSVGWSQSSDGVDMNEKAAESGDQDLAAPDEKVSRKEKKADEAEAPDLSKITKETGQVDDNLTWTGIRRYHLEKNRYQLDLVGGLNSGKFVLKKSKFQRWKKNRWVDIPFDELLSKYDFETTRNGEEYTFSFVFPLGKYRINLAAKVNGNLEQYPFEVEVDNTWPEAPPPALKQYLCDHCMDFGVGFNYLTILHTPNSTLDPLNYASFSLPALDFNYRKKLSRSSGLRLQLAYHNGADLTEDAVTLMNKKIATSSLFLAYESVGTSFGRLFGSGVSSGLAYGVNAYSLPIVRSQTGLTEVYSMQTLSVASLSLGGFWGLRMGTSEFVSKMNVQVPVAATGVTLKQGFSFDGALMLLRHSEESNFTQSEKSPAKGYYWGYQWSGQYHSYQYSIAEEGLTDVSYSSFLSKMEAIFGFAF